MPAYDFYLVEKEPPLAWVYLNRPEKKNAMNPPAWAETIPIFEGLDADDDIRVIIIAGKGAAFSAGIDLVGMGAELPEITDPHQKGGVKQKLIKKIRQLQDAISCIEWCRKPVIAAVHGYCIGAGLDMATACDIRLCSEEAVFSLREAAVALSASCSAFPILWVRESPGNWPTAPKTLMPEERGRFSWLMKCSRTKRH